MLYKALHEVTVVDPALGSGTFPVAMMKHLFLAQTSLGEILSDFPEYESLISNRTLTDHRDPFALKLHIIERSIYGCDIDFFAVQIAKLRFWIELMVNCEHPEALPNFDCKLVVGDALVSAVGTDTQGKLITLEEHLGHPTRSSGQGEISHSIGKLAIEELGQLKHDYFNAKSVEARQMLEKKIKDKQQAMLLSLGIEREKILVTNKHVLWQIDFAEIFSGEIPGFDIAIANPPYLRQELINSSNNEFRLITKKDNIRSIYKNILNVDVSGQADLYVYFYFRSFMLTKHPHGISCFICSNSWLDVSFGRALQKYIVNQTEIRFILENANFRLFDQADINTTINLFIQTDDALNKNARFITSVDVDSSIILRDFSDIYNNKLTRSRVISISNCYLNKELDSNTNSGKWGMTILRAPNVYIELVDRLGNKLKKISELATYYRGVTTGNNDFFIINKRDSSKANIEQECLNPVLSSMKEIEKLFVMRDDLHDYIFKCSSSIEELEKYGFKHALKYIKKFESENISIQDNTYANLIKSTDSSTLKARKSWWILPNQEVGHVVVPRLIRERFMIPVIMDPSIVVTDMFFHVHFHSGQDIELLSAIINSTLTYFFVELFGRKNIGGRINIYGPEIADILLPDPGLFIGDARDCIINCFNKLGGKPIVDIGLDVESKDRYELDKIVFSVLGIEDLYDEIIGAFLTSIRTRVGRENNVSRRSNEI